MAYPSGVNRECNLTNDSKTKSAYYRLLLTLQIITVEGFGAAFRTSCLLLNNLANPKNITKWLLENVKLVS